MRSTAALGIWIGSEFQNAIKVITVLTEFGFDLPELKPEIFIDEDRVVRLGEPPVQIELFSSILGAEFDDCYPNRIIGRWDGADVAVIGRDDLIRAVES